MNGTILGKKKKAKMRDAILAHNCKKLSTGVRDLRSRMAGVKTPVATTNALNHECGARR